MGERRELFAAVKVVVVSSPGVEDLGDDAEATPTVLGRAEHGEQELVGGDARSALGLWGGVATGGQLHHRSDQIHSGEVGVLRFHERGFTSMNIAPSLPRIRSAESAPCQRRSPPRISNHRLASGIDTLVLWLAPPPAPSAVRSLAWKATSDPWSNTDWHMIKGPSTAAWTSTGFLVAAPCNSAGVVTRRTPSDAVPIGSLTKAGNRSQPSTSMAEGGWGIPRRRQRGRRRDLVLDGGQRSEGRHGGGDPGLLEPALGPGEHRHLLLSGEQHVEAAGPVDLEGGVEPRQGVHSVRGNPMDSMDGAGEPAQAHRVGRQNVDHVTVRRQPGGALAGRQPRAVAEQHPHMYIAYTKGCGKAQAHRPGRGPS